MYSTTGKRIKNARIEKGLHGGWSCHRPHCWQGHRNSQDVRIKRKNPTTSSSDGVFTRKVWKKYNNEKRRTIKIRITTKGVIYGNWRGCHALFYHWKIIYWKQVKMNCAIYVRVSTHAQGIKHIESFLMGQKCPYTQLKSLREHFITQVIQNAIQTILWGYFFIASSNAWMMNALWLFAPVFLTDSFSLALNPFGTVNFICS